MGKNPVLVDRYKSPQIHPEGRQNNIKWLGRVQKRLFITISAFVVPFIFLFHGHFLNFQVYLPLSLLLFWDPAYEIQIVIHLILLSAAELPRFKL